MKLLDAKAAFLAFRQPRQSAVAPPDNQTQTAVEPDRLSHTPASVEPQAEADAAEANALDLLCGYFADLSVEAITPVRLHEFLSRWYLEEACVRLTASQPGASFPEAKALIQTLAEFFRWLDKPAVDPDLAENSAGALAQQRNESSPQASPDRAYGQERLAVLEGLQATLPRAIEITGALSASLARCRGAFTFPEFLTSFEEGGHSEYDIGDSGGVQGSLEGYFKVLRIDGVEVEAEERITEARIHPIRFPEEIARLLDAAYICNLELIRLESHWQIVNCGFTYPPDTEL